MPRYGRRSRKRRMFRKRKFHRRGRRGGSIARAVRRVLFNNAETKWVRSTLAYTTLGNAAPYILDSFEQRPAVGTAVNQMIGQSLYARNIVWSPVLQFFHNDGGYTNTLVRVLIMKRNKNADAVELANYLSSFGMFDPLNPLVIGKVYVDKLIPMVAGNQDISVDDNLTYDRNYFRQLKHFVRLNKKITYQSDGSTNVPLPFMCIYTSLPTANASTLAINGWKYLSYKDI